MEIKKSDHMVVRSFEVFRENVCSIHTGDIIFASCGSRFGAIDSLRLTALVNVNCLHVIVIMINPLFSTFDVGRQGQLPCHHFTTGRVLNLGSLFHLASFAGNSQSETIASGS